MRKNIDFWIKVWENLEAIIKLDTLAEIKTGIFSKLGLCQYYFMVAAHRNPWNAYSKS